MYNGNIDRNICNHIVNLITSELTKRSFVPHKFEFRIEQSGLEDRVNLIAELFDGDKIIFRRTTTNIETDERSVNFWKDALVSDFVKEWLVLGSLGANVVNEKCGINYNN